MNFILHLGLGSFHRAHQAVYVHQLRQQGTADSRDWAIAAGNLRPDMADTIAALQAQGGRYTLETVTPQGERSYTVIESIQRVIPYQDDLAPLIAAGADPATRIISFTVTEAGYYLNAQNQLDWPTFADLRADLEAVRAGQAGHTVYGGLVSILRARMLAGAGPVTLMNCDNLRHNGDRSRGGLLQFIDALGDGALKAWVLAHTTSPNAMVDRITPRPTPDVAERVKAATGWDDKAALMGESFIQWVIEDNFVCGRPQWETAGVQMVENVLPWEQMKLRMLNGSHSFLAYLGYLAGFQHISDCMQDSAFREAAYRLMLTEQAPTLQITDVDLNQYALSLLDRFANPALKHKTWQIAMDGSQKLPQRMLDSVRWHRAHHSDYTLLALGVAGWMRYVGGVDEKGQPIEVMDPLLDVIKQTVADSEQGEARVKALLGIQAIFGTDLPADTEFVAAVTRAYLALLTSGAKATVATWAKTHS